MEGLSPGVFGYKPAPSIWHKDLDISDDFLTSYVGNHFDDFDEDDALTGNPVSALSSIAKDQIFDAKGTKMAKLNVDKAFYTSDRMIRLSNDDVQSLCNDWISDWSARRDTAL